MEAGVPEGRAKYSDALCLQHVIFTLWSRNTWLGANELNVSFNVLAGSQRKERDVT